MLRCHTEVAPAHMLGGSFWNCGTSQWQSLPVLSQVGVSLQRISGLYWSPFMQNKDEGTCVIVSCSHGLLKDHELGMSCNAPVSIKYNCFNFDHLEMSSPFLDYRPIQTDSVAHMTLGKESSAVEEWALGGRGIQDTFRLPVFLELCWCFYVIESTGCDLTVNALYMCREIILSS